ncbi:MAG: FHA domain-containing protein [Pseudomonadota bacterium]
MAIIIEVVAVSGKVLERHRLDQKEITIGRAYDNHLILSDNTIDAHHAVISETDDGIFINDLNSINGLRYKHDRIKESKQINSGDELLLGKTHLRVFATNHAVAEAVSIGRQNQILNTFSQPSVAIISLLFLSLLVSLEAWSSSIAEFKLREYIEAVFVIDAIVIIYALIWGIVGKIVKHAMYFKTQLSLISLYMILSYFMQFIYDLLLFNTLNYIFVTVVTVILEIVLLNYLLWLSLEFSTNLSNIKKWFFSLLVAISLILLSMYTEIINHTEFSVSPSLIQKILPPILRMVPSKTIEEFIEESSDIFTH